MFARTLQSLINTPLIVSINALSTAGLLWCLYTIGAVMLNGQSITLLIATALLAGASILLVAISRRDVVMDLPLLSFGALLSSLVVVVALTLIRLHSTISTADGQLSHHAATVGFILLGLTSILVLTSVQHRKRERLSSVGW